MFRISDSRWPDNLRSSMSVVLKLFDPRPLNWPEDSGKHKMDETRRFRMLMVRSVLEFAESSPVAVHLPPN